jgi:hypothetical protein
MSYFIYYRYIRNVRVSLEHKPLVHIKASVWAEMKKSVSYMLDVSLDADGVIQEAQCECGAGMAPTAHCKHVGALMYGLTLFVKTAHLLTELTCTQVKCIGRTKVYSYTNKNIQVECRYIYTVSSSPSSRLMNCMHHMCIHLRLCVVHILKYQEVHNILAYRCSDIDSRRSICIS